MALYEKYETTWPAMREIMKADDFKVTLATVEASRAKWTATVNNKAIYADYHSQVKTYPFPGVKPKPIAHAVTTPIARTTAGRSSESTSGDKASKAASAAKNDA
ncbi:hypothetical protein EAF00_003266 [Botryotinia globosa]|nr:hypothetical protein EAF00_003266 [Botryotinia globosa]